MNAAQKDIVDVHRSDIIEVLETYSKTNTAIIWLVNRGYVNESAENQVKSKKTDLAKAVHTLECLVAEENGWLGLMKFLEGQCNDDNEDDNENLTRSLESELTSRLSRILNNTDSLVFTQAESSHCVPSNISSVTPIWLECLRHQLKSFYTTSFAQVKLFPNDHASAIPVEKIWVNLRKEEVHKEEDAHEDYLVALNVALESGLPIIIKGEPGIGKTTLMLKICYDWATGKLPQFDLVICGKMRAVPEADTILDIALEWTTFRCPTINLSSLKINLRESKLNLLVILDGYDESICHCNEVDRLLKSADSFLLPFRLVITTRSYKLYEIACPHHLLTVRGFSPPQQLQFVENFCKLQRKDAISVQMKIQSTPSLSSLCRIPLFIYFICCLSEYQSLDGSMTQLLYLLCESLLSRYQASTQTAAELANWTKLRWIENLGQLAFYGLKDCVDGKLCFNHCDLVNRGFKSNHVAYSVGFLNKEEIIARIGIPGELSASFPHKVFQEFFAALALSTDDTAYCGSSFSAQMRQDFFFMLKNESQRRLEMRQVLIFLAGMEGGRASSFEYLRSNEITFAPTLEDNLTLLQQVAIECTHQQQAADLVREFFNGSQRLVLAQSDWQLAVNLYNTAWRQSDSAAIPCKAEGSSQLLLWDLSNNRWEAHVVNTLEKHTVEDHQRNNLHQLKYAWFAGAKQQLVDLAKSLQRSQLSLNMLRVTLERDGEDTHVAWPAMPTLWEVVVESTSSGWTGLVPRALQSLLEAQPAIQWLVFRGVENQRVTSLDCHCWPNTITELTFHRVSFDATLVNQLCQVLDRLHLTTLHIHKASLQLEAFASLFRALSKQRHLKELSLVSIRMDGLQSPEGCQTLGECCRWLTFLQHLIIMDCGVTDAVAECLLSSIQAMRGLKTVCLEFNPLSQTMINKLHYRSGLHKNPFVQI